MDEERKKRFEKMAEAMGTEELRSHAMQELPELAEELEDTKRLLALAKQSPFAGANKDFLRRVELELEKRSGLISLAKKVLGLGT